MSAKSYSQQDAEISSDRQFLQFCRLGSRVGTTACFFLNNSSALGRKCCTIRLFKILWFRLFHLSWARRARRSISRNSHCGIFAAGISIGHNQIDYLMILKPEIFELSGTLCINQYVIHPSLGCCACETPSNRCRSQPYVAKAGRDFELSFPCCLADFGRSSRPVEWNANATRSVDDVLLDSSSGYVWEFLVHDCFVVLKKLRL